ncbi:MAG TPA: hypothetical protein VK400_14960 [Pyrinomonadaceae bacterium]|nr:hypothetical protein [Pyrinomonadaceae bacterium]
MRKILMMLAIGVFACALSVSAQPRPVETKTPAPAPKKPAPPSFEAKYEGGMFGFSKKEEGTLKFDDLNERIVFYGKDQKEKFGIPYDAMLIIYPQSQSVRSTTGNVIRNLPLPGAILGGLIREKRRYLIVHFQDEDVEARGVINFKIDDRELLDSVLATLAEKASLTQRGDAYYKPKKVATKQDDQ